MNTEQGNLVKLLEIDNEFIIDLKYATAENFTGKQIYMSGECYMDKHTAEILIKAKDYFKKDGYRVKIWDAYRPISAQERFWEIMPDDDFVARPPTMGGNPKLRPTHLNGLCVDITLTDEDGNDILMPSEFDDFSKRSSLLCQESPIEARKNGSYMKAVMESVGFKAYENEWWHFYDVTTDPKPPMNFQI